MTFIGSNLEDAKRLYINRVRERARIERELVASPSKDRIYERKLADAEEVLHGGPAGQYVTAQAERDKTSKKKAAQLIVDAAERTERRLVEVDRLELDAIASIRRARNVGEPHQIFSSIDWTGEHSGN